MDAHKLTLHHIFIAVSLPYLTESEQHACFPRTGRDEISIPTGGLLSCFLARNNVQKKGGMFPRETTHRNAPAMQISGTVRGKE